MINLFQFAPNDQSLYYLSQVFGNVGTVLPIQGNVPLILSVMFRTFNSIILAVAVLVIVYITVVGVMKTAGEGEFLGKGWNSLWVPIRMVLGVAALVPAPSGYSGIQIVMMWVIVQGIGAADTIWNTAVTTISLTGSPYAGVQIDQTSTTDSIGRLFQGLVCASTAYRKDDNPSNPGADKGGYYCKSHANEPFCQPGRNLYDLASNSTCFGDQCVMQLGPHIAGLPGSCGTLTYCNKGGSACSDSTSLKCTGCTSQVEALTTILNTLGAIADKFSQEDYNYRSFYSGGGTPPSWVTAYCNANGIDPKQCCKSFLIILPGMPLPPNVCLIGLTLNDGDSNNLNRTVAEGMMWPYVLSQAASVNGANFIQVSITDYLKTLQEALSAQISALVAKGNTQLPPQLQDARDTGWIFAGAYYYYIAQMNNNNLKDANPVFSVVAPNGSDPASDTDNMLNIYRNNYGTAGDLVTFLSTIASSGNQGFSDTTPTKLQKLSSSAFSAESGIMSSFMNTVTGGDTSTGATQNPLAKVQSLGESILLTIEILFSVLLVVIFALAMAGNIDVFALGTGAVDPLGPTLATVLLFVVPIMLGFMGTFMGIGATLAVYVPLVPYMIFTFGVIGWFIATIEAMIAGPIVALGIMTPGGQHEVLGRAEPALMMLFGIFLRPALMVFGMMAAMLLSAVVVTMINASFETVMLQITAYQLGNQSSLPGQTSGSGGGGVDLLELIFFMSAYVMLVISVLNKCFALIHIIPDRVLRWIGHHGAEEGAPHLEEVKGGVGATAGAAGGAAKEGTTMPAKAGQAEKDNAAKRREAKAGKLDEDKEK